MLYLVTILLPPLGVLLTGRVGSFALNCPLTLCYYIPGLIHGLAVVADFKEEERAKRASPLAGEPAT